MILYCPVFLFALFFDLNLLLDFGFSTNQLLFSPLCVEY